MEVALFSGKCINTSTSTLFDDNPELQQFYYNETEKQNYYIRPLQWKRETMALFLNSLNIDV